jgi:alkanesulfonate monooxygenase SsuD/methylene tetrahydromethanopterin reductase-like flavin-dependent oxidoreductase (luciferase family)
MGVVVHSVVRYGLSVPCFGVGVDAALLARWAAVAETAGWDGFFLWDHLFPFSPGPVDVVDPWISLTAAAVGTTAIRLGTLVTPLPRRRPMVVARQTATLDRLSGGRLILGVGIGAGPYEWEYCGEQADPRIRGDMLDEHLGLLDRLWSGAAVHHDGTHYRLAGPEWSAVCYPPPRQQPRIPIWVAGTWPGTRPFTRAARWDGVVPMRPDGHWNVQDTAAVAHRLHSLRTGDHVDVAVPGESDGTDNHRTARFAAHESAGATWWVEAIHPWRYGWTEGAAWPLNAMENRIAQGP